MIGSSSRCALLALSLALASSPPALASNAASGGSQGAGFRRAPHASQAPALSPHLIQTAGRVSGQALSLQLSAVAQTAAAPAAARQPTIAIAEVAPLIAIAPTPAALAPAASSLSQALAATRNAGADAQFDGRPKSPVASFDPRTIRFFGRILNRWSLQHPQPASPTRQARLPTDDQWTPSQYRGLTLSWEASLLNSFEQPPTVYGPLARLRSALNLIRNKLFIFELRRRLKPIKERLDAGGMRMAEAGRRIQAAISKMRSSPWRGLYAGRLLDVMDDSIKNGPRSLARGLEQKRWVEQATRDFNEDWARYKTIYGARYFTDSGRDRALMNVVAMTLFGKFEGIDTSTAREAINAIAFLHPVTDDLIDSGAMKKETIGKITRRLRGIKDPAEYEYEKLVFALIDAIYERYPRETNPMLDWLLNDLWRAQLASGAQKSEVGSSLANRHTIQKGGLSTSAFGYIALGNLTPKQYEFFFKAGSLYQWMDDFSDIGADMNDGIETLWTGSLQRREPLERRFATVIRLKDELLAREDVFSAFKDGAGIRDFFHRGFYLQYLTAAASNRRFVGSSPYQAMARRLSLTSRDMEAANQYLLPLFQAGRSADRSGFTEALERFLLNGR